MMYEFYENKYPIGDPNLNLNFNDDILYKYLVDHDNKINIHDYENGEQESLPGGEKYTKKKKDNNKFGVYLTIIFMSMFLLIIWYINMPEKKLKKKSNK